MSSPPKGGRAHPAGAVVADIFTRSRSRSFSRSTISPRRSSCSAGSSCSATRRSSRGRMSGSASPRRRSMPTCSRMRSPRTTVSRRRSPTTNASAARRDWAVARSREFGACVPQKGAGRAQRARRARLARISHHARPHPRVGTGSARGGMSVCARTRRDPQIRDARRSERPLDHVASGSRAGPSRA